MNIKKKKTKEKKMSDQSKKNDLDNLLDTFKEEFGEGSVTVFEKDSYKLDKEAISTGSILLDRIMWSAEKGGYVKGKIFEIFGLQSSGKSTLAFHAVRECQKNGEKAVYFDLENAIDSDYIKGIGINTKELIISYPRSGEEAFDMMIKFIEMDVGLIVVDSVSNLVPRSQLDGSIEKIRIGAHASLMSIGLRKVKNAITGKKTIIIFINQIRNNINTSFFSANSETVTGGLALQYEADLRLRLKFKERIEEKDRGIIGIKIEVKVIKNRFFRPFGKTELEIIYPEGIKKSREILKIALEENIILRKGGWYFYKEKNIGSGLSEVINFLETDKKSFCQIEREFFVKC